MSVENLKARAQEFVGVFDRFLAARPWVENNPQLAADWDKAYAYAIAVKNSIMWINQQVDGAVNWLSKTVGISGVQELNGMQAVPIISAAYLLGASAALTFAIDWMIRIITAADIERQKIELVRTGKADQTILYQGGITGAMGGATNLIKWGIIGAAAWFLIPKILERVQK